MVTMCYSALLCLYSASVVAGTYKAVVISSFCKFLAIPVYIWAGDWGSLLPEVLQIGTRFQVFKGNGDLVCVHVVCSPPSRM